MKASYWGSNTYARVTTQCEVDFTYGRGRYSQGPNPKVNIRHKGEFASFKVAPFPLYPSSSLIFFVTSCHSLRSFSFFGLLFV